VFHLFRTTSLLHQRQGLGGVNVDPNYFTIILQSSVGTLEGHSESVCIGRNRCATYTNHAIKFHNPVLNQPVADVGLDRGIQFHTFYFFSV